MKESAEKRMNMYWKKTGELAVKGARKRTEQRLYCYYSKISCM